MELFSLLIMLREEWLHAARLQFLQFVILLILPLFVQRNLYWLSILNLFILPNSSLRHWVRDSLIAEPHARAKRARADPIPKGKWKPIDARKFGYDVSVRPYVLTDCGRGSGMGVGLEWLAISKARNKSGQSAFFLARILTMNWARWRDEFSTTLSFHFSWEKSAG